MRIDCLELYYDTTRNRLISANGLPLNTAPVLTVQETPTLLLHLVSAVGAQGSLTYADIAGLSLFSAAVDSDYNPSSTPMARTVSGITCAAEHTILTIPLNLNTESAGEALGARRDIAGTFELTLSDAEGALKRCIQFAVRIRGRIDPDTACDVVTLKPYVRTLSIGTVNTVAPDVPASVENVGTPSEIELSFSIPRGANALSSFHTVTTLTQACTLAAQGGLVSVPASYAGSGFSLPNLLCLNPGAATDRSLYLIFNANAGHYVILFVPDSTLYAECDLISGRVTVDGANCTLNWSPHYSQTLMQWNNYTYRTDMTQNAARYKQTFNGNFTFDVPAINDFSTVQLLVTQMVNNSTVTLASALNNKLRFEKRDGTLENASFTELFTALGTAQKTLLVITRDTDLLGSGNYLVSIAAEIA